MDHGTAGPPLGHAIDLIGGDTVEVDVADALFSSDGQLLRANSPQSTAPPELVLLQRNGMTMACSSPNSMRPPEEKSPLIQRLLATIAGCVELPRVRSGED
jgi:hypothetical protein